MITERPVQRRTPGAPERPGRAPRSQARRNWVATFRAYLTLTKPQIVELLLVTTVPTMMLAAGGWPDPVTFTAVLVGGGLAGGAASALNCYIDRDIDELMRRTKRRPLPANQMTPRAVLIFGLTLAVISVALMALLTNWLATALTAFSIFYYDVVYTLWLKRRTPANTFWGGVCGAAPVVIGWAAVTGTIPPMAWALFAIVFFWQMPHFYALAVKYKDDYARAGVPMLPVVRSMKRVNFEIVLYTVLTVVASLVAWPLGLGPIYGVTAIVMGGVFLFEAVRLARQEGGGAAVRPMRLFHLSITYLTVVFMAVAVDALI
ncbi:heme o synthase [Actinoplanes sp. NEAU-A12]|uniref:Protoheme IX farnesyltransferase n=1 Tax=Actinoplanes sandaracinus TaxID=3045177 RepID=A0ABT6X098_9ACTN|nr:heme o synthase [Actinoplanes sandaracinus]MDI6105382.1 heme o synthase [Actinoplanes sandaracinus]